jgi:hypothetical protein
MLWCLELSGVRAYSFHSSSVISVFDDDAHLLELGGLQLPAASVASGMFALLLVIVWFWWRERLSSATVTSARAGLLRQST